VQPKQNQAAPAGATAPIDAVAAEAADGSDSAALTPIAAARAGRLIRVHRSSGVFIRRRVSDGEGAG